MQVSIIKARTMSAYGLTIEYTRVEGTRCVISKCCVRGYFILQTDLLPKFRKHSQAKNGTEYTTNYKLSNNHIQHCLHYLWLR